MATWGPDDVSILLDGYDLSGETFENGPINIGMLQEESRGYGDVWSEVSYIGVKEWSFDLRARYDDAALKINAALVSSLGLNRVLGISIEGGAKGKKITIANPGQLGYARQPEIAGLLKAGVRFAGRERIEDMTILQRLQAASAAGATPDGSTDNGAGTSNGGRAAIFITSLTLGGYTSLTVNLQESQNDGGADPYATKVALATAVTAAPFAAIVPMTGTIERWLRPFLVWNGAGSGQSVTLLVAAIRD